MTIALGHIEILSSVILDGRDLRAASVIRTVVGFHPSGATESFIWICLRLRYRIGRCKRWRGLRWWHGRFGQRFHDWYLVLLINLQENEVFFYAPSPLLMRQGHKRDYSIPRLKESIPWKSGISGNRLQESESKDSLVAIAGDSDEGDDNKGIERVERGEYCPLKETNH